jgi:hypothetical protein
MLTLILLVFAFVFAIIAALVSQRPTPPPGYFGAVHWGWLSIAFLIASMLFGPAGPIMHLGKLGSIARMWIG